MVSSSAPMPAWRDELRALRQLALPVIAVNLGLHAMGVVDVIMVGHVARGDVALAAVGLGTAYSFSSLILAMGVLMAIDPVVSQALGAGDDERAARGIQRGLFLAAALTLPAVLLHLTAGPILRLLEQPGEVVPKAVDYTWVSTIGVLPFLVFVALRQSLQSLGYIRPILLTILVANVVNVFLNWMLIYGNLGFEPRGVVGSSWATASSRWLLATMLLLASRPVIGRFLRPLRPGAIAREPLVRTLRLGLPIGFQFQLEHGAFVAALFMVGWFGEQAQAGHMVAINLASISFMIPMGISAAAAVRVGRHVGARDLEGTRRAAGVAVFLGAGVMSVFSLLFFCFPQALASVYSDEPEVVAVAVTLLPIAAVFQIFDGLQVVAIGALRGLGDTRVPMQLGLVAFWILGLPISLVLADACGLEARGIWWGLVAGLAIVSALLSLRLRRRLRHAVEPLEI